MSIPWTNLWNGDFVVEIEDISLSFDKPSKASATATGIYSLIRDNELDMLSSVHLAGDFYQMEHEKNEPIEIDESNGIEILASIINRVISRMRINVNNVKVRFLDEDGLSLSIPSLSLRDTSLDLENASNNENPLETAITKLLLVPSLNITLGSQVLAEITNESSLKITIDESSINMEWFSDILDASINANSMAAFISFFERIQGPTSSGAKSIDNLPTKKYPSHNIVEQGIEGNLDDLVLGETSHIFYSPQAEDQFYSFTSDSKTSIKEVPASSEKNIGFKVNLRSLCLNIYPTEKVNHEDKLAFTMSKIYIEFNSQKLLRRTQINLTFDNCFLNEFRAGLAAFNIFSYITASEVFKLTMNYSPDILDISGHVKTFELDVDLYILDRYVNFFKSSKSARKKKQKSDRNVLLKISIPEIIVKLYFGTETQENMKLIIKEILVSLQSDAKNEEKSNILFECSHVDILSNDSSILCIEKQQEAKIFAQLSQNSEFSPVVESDEDVKSPLFGQRFVFFEGESQRIMPDQHEIMKFRLENMKRSFFNIICEFPLALISEHRSSLLQSSRFFEKLSCWEPLLSTVSDGNDSSLEVFKSFDSPVTPLKSFDHPSFCSILLHFQTVKGKDHVNGSNINVFYVIGHGSNYSNIGLIDCSELSFHKANIIKARFEKKNEISIVVHSISSFDKEMKLTDSTVDFFCTDGYLKLSRDFEDYFKDRKMKISSDSGDEYAYFTKLSLSITKMIIEYGKLDNVDIAAKISNISVSSNLISSSPSKGVKVILKGSELYLAPPTSVKLDLEGSTVEWARVGFILFSNMDFIEMSLRYNPTIPLKWDLEFESECLKFCFCKDSLKVLQNVLAPDSISATPFCTPESAEFKFDSEIEDDLYRKYSLEAPVAERVAPGELVFVDQFFDSNPEETEIISSQPAEYEDKISILENNQLEVKEDYFSIPSLNSIDENLAKLGICTGKLKIINSSVSLSIFEGKDFAEFSHGHKSERDEKNHLSIILEGICGEHDVLQDDNNSTYTKLSIKNFEIIDEIQSSVWNKFLTYLKDEERQTDSVMTEVSVVGVKTDANTEYRMKASFF